MQNDRCDGQLLVAGFTPFCLLVAFLLSSPGLWAGATAPTSGVLNSDGRWRVEDSPVNLDGDLTVPQGVTLTIDPGVEVHTNGFSVLVEGTLQALGTLQSPIRISGRTNNMITFTETSAPWDEMSGQGCIIDFAEVHFAAGPDIAYSIRSLESSPRISRNTFTGEGNTLSMDLRIEGGQPVIEENRFVDELGQRIGISVAGGSPVIRGNVFLGLLTGFGSLVPTREAFTLEGNLWMSNGVAVELVQEILEPDEPLQQLLLQNNTLAGNGTAFLVGSGEFVTLSDNNIFANALHIEMAPGSQDKDLDARNNWWGTTDLEAIRQSIEDVHDDPNLGEVLIEPIRNEPAFAPSAGADIEISKQADQQSAGLGTHVAFAIKVTNLSSLEASGVTVTDPLPEGAGLISVDASQGDCFPDSQRVTCLLGTLEGGAHADIEVVLRADRLGELTNTASVESGRPDPLLSNNSASASVAILGPTLLFPQYVNGESNKTRIVLRNNGSEADEGSVRFLDASGHPVDIVIGGTSASEFAYSLVPWGAIEVETDGSGPLQAGPLLVYSNRALESHLEGAVIFEILGSSVSVASAPPRASQQAYVSVTTDENTGIALYNPDSENPVVVRLILFDGQGLEQARRDLTVQPSSQLTRFLDEEGLLGDYFEAHPGVFKGTLSLIVVEGSEVPVIGLLQNRSTGALFAVPISPNAQLQ